MNGPLPTLPRMVTNLDGNPSFKWLTPEHWHTIPRTITHLSYDSHPASGYTPLLGWSPTFPRMVTYPFQNDHPPFQQCSPILHGMVNKKPNKIWMELAQSNHCELRKCPKIDPIMLILDKLNMSLSRHIFADMRIDGSTGSTLPDQTNKIQERKI